MTIQQPPAPPPGVSFTLTGDGQGPRRKRDSAWFRLAPGLYETGDGRYRVHNPLAAAGIRHRTWYLGEADETSPDGWAWTGKYGSKAAAMADTPAPYKVQPRNGVPDVRANPGNANGDYKETPDVIAAAHRQILAAGTRAGKMDLGALAALGSLHEAVEQAIGNAARTMTAPAEPGDQRVRYSWADIGGALGTTRQAAYDKYHDPAGTRRKR